MALEYIVINELDAVNTMLEVIGEQPVNTLDDSGLSEATIALKLLHKTSRVIQSTGLNCNSIDAVTLPLDINDKIPVAVSTLKIDASDSSIKIALRGNYLFDLENNTYEFEEPVEVDLVEFLPFDELPTHVREYITVRAAMKFQARFLGSNQLHTFTKEDLQEVKVEFMQAEIDNGDYNFRSGSNYNAITSRTSNS